MAGRRRLFDLGLVTISISCLTLSSLIAQTGPAPSLERKWTGRGYALCGSCDVPGGITSRVQLVPQNEPGEPVVLAGVVFKADGVTPDSGITLFLYQTDSGGYYHRPEEDVFHPRIFGWIRTGRDGRYEIRTIRPAPEVLEKDAPAHIHVHLFSPGIPEHFVHEFWFQGDLNIPPAEAEKYARMGDFSPIVRLQKGLDGVWRGTRNIRVVPAPAWRYERD